MERLKQSAKPAQTGKSLITILNSLPITAGRRDELADSIMQFAESTAGKDALAGKENSLKESTDPVNPQASKPKSLSVVEGIQCICPRGKFDLRFRKDSFELCSGKQELDILYSRIKHIAIFDKIQKDTKARVLLYIHLTRDDQSKIKAAAEAVLIQIMQGAELSIPSPASKEIKLTGEGAVVLCQAFGAVGVPPSVFVAPQPDLFQSYRGTGAIAATVRVDQGWLFPLESAFCFVEKPAIWVSHDRVRAVEFGRTTGSSRTFDFHLHLEDGRNLEFSSLAREDLGPLSTYVEQSCLKIGGVDDCEGSEGKDMRGAPDSDSEEEDSDFDPEAESEAGAAKKAAGRDYPEMGEGSDSEGSASEADSDVSVVSDEGVPASKVRAMVAEAAEQKKRRRLK